MLLLPAEPLPDARFGSRLQDPNVQCWGTEEDDDGDPPRLWAPNGMYPGTAFTRSIGDSAAERIGVTAEPECKARQP